MLLSDSKLVISFFKSLSSFHGRYFTNCRIPRFHAAANTRKDVALPWLSKRVHWFKQERKRPQLKGKPVRSKISCSIQRCSNFLIWSKRKPLSYEKAHQAHDVSSFSRTDAILTIISSVQCISFISLLHYRNLHWTGVSIKRDFETKTPTLNAADIPWNGSELKLRSALQCDKYYPLDMAREVDIAFRPSMISGDQIGGLAWSLSSCRLIC